jgi:SAM-dependent methyltransferase
VGYDREKLRRMLRNEADMAAKRRLEAILDYLDPRPEDRVLDCGCGLGWVIKVFDEVAPSQLTGIDSDLTRLRRAQAELDRVPISAGSVMALPYPDGHFDKVILSEVLEHVPDDLSALLEVRRVVRPGGVIAITVPYRNYPFLWDPINWTLERFGRPPIREGLLGGIWTNHLRLYERAELIELVERAGLIAEDPRQLVHHCFPFAHNLVYGVGMRLVESGLLPGADRFRYEHSEKRRFSFLNAARAVFNSIDRRNRRSEEGRTAVNLTVRARRPESAVL